MTNHKKSHPPKASLKQQQVATEAAAANISYAGSKYVEDHTDSSSSSLASKADINDKAKNNEAKVDPTTPWTQLFKNNRNINAGFALQMFDETSESVTLTAEDADNVDLT